MIKLVDVEQYFISFMNVPPPLRTLEDLVLHPQSDMVDAVLLLNLLNQSPNLISSLLMRGNRSAAKEDFRPEAHNQRNLSLNDFYLPLQPVIDILAEIIFKVFNSNVQYQKVSYVVEDFVRPKSGILG